MYNVVIAVPKHLTVIARKADPLPERSFRTYMYTVNSIRNICLLGHSGSGKSALAESLLYMTGAIVRMGKNANGNTVADYDPEEVRRNISISTSVIPVEYKNHKINILDTPGAFASICSMIYSVVTAGSSFSSPGTTPS